jgi:hypothetical protein
VVIDVRLLPLYPLDCLFAAANVELSPFFVERIVIVCSSEKNQHLNINMDEEESKDEDRSWGGEAASTLSSSSSVQVQEVTVTQAKRPATA